MNKRPLWKLVEDAHRNAALKDELKRQRAIRPLSHAKRTVQAPFIRRAQLQSIDDDCRQAATPEMMIDNNQRFLRFRPIRLVDDSQNAADCRQNAYRSLLAGRCMLSIIKAPFYPSKTNRNRKLISQLISANHPLDSPGAGRLVGWLL